MTKTDLPTPETLRKLLSYDPDTGLLTWKRRPIEMFATKNAFKSWNTRYCGNLAFGSIDGRGYRQGAIFSKYCLGHRVAYAVYYGVWPVGDIDHINGDRADNRIANLRDVTRSENQRNSKIPSNNTSGRIGVSWHSNTRKWLASIGVGERKQKHLGIFTNIEDAIAARAAAEVEYGYHPNHGRPQPLA